MIIKAPRRVPAGAELALLMRCTGYRFTRTGVATGATEPPGEDDREQARRLGWPIGVPERSTAAELVDRAIAAADRLDLDAVLGAFVAGVGASAPRGRQVLISYAWARHLRTAPRDPGSVPDCGLHPVEELDVTEKLVRIACGWAWNELPVGFVPDLEAAAVELPAPTAADRAVLVDLLALIAGQPAGTTPGQLERAVGRAKLLPRTDKYQRYGILTGLAEFGVLPSPVLAPSYDRFVPVAEQHAAYRQLRGAPRSDITVPLAGWRGGLDQTRADRLLATAH
ncbi:hypothetical protein O7627_06685 [Solwaraspora sp. WMMD1047]|uniref:hypothetical protein n=1 Tax=Solwaraspora sp. WMMD1047 TaxID=3016102 RepID=UPI00241784F1|nr:hypothetical protein [Solwaraspora sp. WMMD1047]MDG4828993.1 hypothetical protein [Solwaraspora sp. WMMD1047]